jgi:hypothetical protein
MTMQSSAYPLIDGLVDLACRDGVEIRPTLLRVLTDLYVQKPVHSAEEEAQYVELALRLIDAVDAPTRAAVASRLSTYAGAPTVILRRLIEIAARPNVPATAPIEARPAAPQAVREGDLTDLFFAAAPAERRLILDNLDVTAGPAPRRAVPAASEVVRRLETAALARNPGEFARMLARALNIAPALAERVARDGSGEPIMVAAKALGMPAAVFQRVLLFLNPAVGQSVERVYELARHYDEMQPAAAERMLEIWRQSGGQRRPAQEVAQQGVAREAAHEPMHWDDERRDARAAATPARHRAAPGRAEATPRHKANER